MLLVSFFTKIWNFSTLLFMNFLNEYSCKVYILNKLSFIIYNSMKFLQFISLIVSFILKGFQKCLDTIFKYFCKQIFKDPSFILIICIYINFFPFFPYWTNFHLIKFASNLNAFGSFLYLWINNLFILVSIYDLVWGNNIFGICIGLHDRMYFNLNLRWVIFYAYFVFFFRFYI